MSDARLIWSVRGAFSHAVKMFNWPGRSIEAWKVRKRVTHVLARGGQTVTGWLLARSVESLSYLFFRGSRNNRAFFRVFFRGSRERSIVSRDPRNNTLFRVIRERISRTLSSQGPWCSTPFFQSYRGPWKAMMHRVISIDETA